MRSRLARFQIDDEAFAAVDGESQLPLGEAEGLAGSSDGGAELGCVVDYAIVTEREDCMWAIGFKRIISRLGSNYPELAESNEISLSSSSA
ncbi:hypothetical protein [Sphingosinicella microcystinivorans]|uniref:Uncharacterized protein n=1 Tax=Sphingosinicella microcystinivorans TaxID=335406 RepID=A0AAD1D3T0_SPHMI|nr:hypothetical protein [Sphingosinicella microcystinivorans]BBE33261.1 hypothetical protein SmB9_09190 [Sphingosinicella microcystinivorans]